MFRVEASGGVPTCLIRYWAADRFIVGWTCSPFHLYHRVMVIRECVCIFGRWFIRGLRLREIPLGVLSDIIKRLLARVEVYDRAWGKNDCWNANTVSIQMLTQGARTQTRSGSTARHTCGYRLTGIHYSLFRMCKLTNDSQTDRWMNSWMDRQTGG